MIAAAVGVVMWKRILQRSQLKEEKKEIQYNTKSVKIPGLFIKTVR